MDRSPRQQQVSQSEVPLTTGLIQPLHFQAQGDRENESVENLAPHESRFQANLATVPVRSVMSAVIQPKLTIGAPNDKYEQEADRVAQQVVQRLHAPTLERPQSGDTVQREVEPDDDDELQMKPFLQRQGGEAVAASDELATALQYSRGGGQPLAKTVREPMEQAFGGIDFSGVKVHTDAQSDQLNHSIQAKAFTTGQDIYMRQGAYAPGSRSGQELIAHELTHVVQQNGGAVQRSLQPTHHPIIQRYTVEEIGGDKTRLADDQTAAVTQESDYGGHEMFAEEGLVKAAQKKLNDAKSGIKLQISARTMSLPQDDGSTKILKEVWPRNEQNKTGGIKKPSLADKIKAKVSGKPMPKPQLEMMQLWADCGKANGVVIGGSRRRAVFESQTDDTVEKTRIGSPAKMKAEVLMKVLSEVADKMEAKMNTLEEDTPDHKAYQSMIEEIRDEELWTATEWGAVKDLIKTASTDEDWEEIHDKYDEIADHVLKLYDSFSKENQDVMNRNAGINEYANPDIGQGFTISSGGKSYPKKNTWNFHWAGVVLKSANGADSVTLENYAVGDSSVENDKWVFQMYGHKRKKQSFHSEHQRSKLHGKTPTTMVVENVPTR